MIAATSGRRSTEQDDEASPRVSTVKTNGKNPTGGGDGPEEN